VSVRNVQCSEAQSIDSILLTIAIDEVCSWFDSNEMDKRIGQEPNLDLRSGLSITPFGDVSGPAVRIELALNRSDANTREESGSSSIQLPRELFDI